MKKVLSALIGLFLVSGASAADITVFHSPYCPHCHHAREFIGGELIYEYPKLKVVEVDVMVEKNLPEFRKALEKCKYDNGGVPVIVVGEKCFQGYADFMKQDLRDAVEADMSDEDKKVAAENKKAFDKDPQKFKADNSKRLEAIKSNTAVAAEKTQKKNNDQMTQIGMWVLLGALVVALGFVLLRKKK